MVWEREVELDVDVGRDLGMVRELLAAVERDGPERLALKGPRHLLSDAFRGLAPADAAVEAAGVDAAIDGGKCKALRHDQILRLCLWMNRGY